MSARFNNLLISFSAALFRVLLVVAGVAQAHQVAVGVRQLWVLVSVFDVVHLYRLTVAAVLPALSAQVAVTP